VFHKKGRKTMTKFSILKKYDKKNMEKLLKEFPVQLNEAFSLSVPLPKNKNFNKICFCGMGGSAIGGDVLRIFVESDSSFPFYIHRNYSLPNFADRKTLLMVISYSGNTEEAISAYRKAKKIGCTTWVLTGGGKLLNMAKKDKVPFVKIPAGLPPRCAFGYLFFPCFTLMKKLNILKKSIPAGFFEKIKKTVNTFAVTNDKNNEAKNLSVKFYQKVPIFYSGNLFHPVMSRWKTQLSENSKNFSFINVLPEMNHNEIMSWNFPKWFIEKTMPVFVKSSEYYRRIKDRIEITQKLISKSNSDTIIIETEGKTLIEKFFNLIILGDWVSYYLALLNHTDPTEIKEIDFLKKSLKK